MTTVDFLKKEDKFYGFSLKGHSGYAEAGEDIVCSAISSAVYLSANTMSLVSNSVSARVDDGFISVSVDDDSVPQYLFEGLYNHLLQLSEQYPDNVKISILNYQEEN